MQSFESSEKAEATATKLCQMFGDSSHQWFPFYCKVAYKLPESKIWQNYERAIGAKKKEANSSAKLFYWLCNKDISRL